MGYELGILDIDGVLADFYSSAARVLGYDPEELRQLNPPGIWDMTCGTGISEDTFWKCIDETPDFWESLAVLPTAIPIIEVCERYFGDNVILLTSPSRNPTSWSGKAAWIKRHFPQYFSKLAVGLMFQKWRVAHPGAVLIDDHERNCVGFEKAGGKSVLVPGHGNRLYALVNDAPKVVEQELEKLFTE